MTKATRVLMHNDESGWWADSPDVPGWTALGSDESDLISLIDEAANFVPFQPYVRVYGLMPSRVDTWAS